MPEYTNLAQILANVFLKFEKNISDASNNSTLLEIWTKTLGGQGQDQLDIVSNIGSLAKIFLKLEIQIKESQRFDQDQRQSANHCLNQFKVFFSFQRFHEGAVNHKSFCNSINRGNLRSIGMSLEYEFRELKLDGKDTQEIIVDLKRIKEILSHSVIPLHLKVNLEKHLNSMLWWLSNPEMTSIQDLLETSGSALLIAKQIESSTPNSASSEADEKGGLFRGCFNVADRLFRLAQSVVKVNNTYESLSNDFHHFMGIIPPT